MKSINYEDIIMKRAMDVFAEEGLKFFGIEKKVKEVSPTEIVVLEAKNMFISAVEKQIMELGLCFKMYILH